MITQKQHMLVVVAAGICAALGFLYYMKQHNQLLVPAREVAQEVSAPEPVATPEVVNVPQQPEAKGVVTITTQQEFDRVVAASQKPVVVKVSTTWCGPCKMLKPVFKRVAQQLSPRIVFVDIDYDQYDQQQALGVKAFPTLILYKDGKEVSRLEGHREQDELTADLQKLL